MKHYKHTIIAIFAIAIIGTPWIINTFPQSKRIVDSAFSYIGNNVVAVFMHQTITVVQLKNKYNAVPKGQPKIKILIVPGHEPNYGGAEYEDLKEREMTVELGRYLQDFFNNNSHYEVVISRSKDSWNPVLQSYFDQHWTEIQNFFKDSKNEMVHLLNTGMVQKKVDGIVHNKAREDVALRLYGMNKWSNENKIDIAIHIHFNDYPGHGFTGPGDYSGLAIYVPERQYSNSTTTRVIADSVFKRLAKYNAISDLPKEKSGVIEEQDLIAIGAYNTSDAPSMLIEYGYIYEPQFTDPAVRASTLRDLAFQTYLGIQDFFGSGNDISLAYDTLMLPYNWKGDITKNNSNKNDVMALQTALLLEGIYPPSQMTKNDCPRSGKFGPCTLNALKTYQNINSIKNEENIVGTQTRKALNNKYSVQFK